MILGFCCSAMFIYSIVLAERNPAVSYELSIYSSTPTAVWISVFVCSLTGTAIVLLSVRYVGVGETLMRRLGLLISAMGYVLLIAVVPLRQYRFWMPTDPLTHLGWTEATIGHGQIPSQLHYPIMHLLTAMLAACTDGDTMTVAMLLPSIAAVSLPLFAWLIGRILTRSRFGAAVCFLLAVAPVYGWYVSFTPNHLAVLLFPLLLWVVIKNLVAREFRWLLIMVAVVVLAPMIHPSIGAVITAILLAFWTRSRFASISGTGDAVGICRVGTGRIAVLASIWTFFWLSFFLVLEKALTGFNSVLSGYGSSGADNLEKLAAYASVHGYNPWHIFAVRYFGPCLLIALALFFAFASSRRVSLETVRLRAMIGAAFVSVTLLMIGLMPLNPGFSPLRLIALSAILAIPIVALGFSDRILLPRRNGVTGVSRAFHLVFVSALVVSLTALGAVTIYPSPITYSANPQITSGDVEGMGWFITERDPTIQYSGLTDYAYRYAYLFIPLEDETNYVQWQNLKWSIRIPSNFGYDTHSELWEAYGNETYVVFRDKDLLYQQVFPGIEDFRFTGSSLMRITVDTSADLVYTGGGFSIYLVQASAA